MGKIKQEGGKVERIKDKKRENNQKNKNKDVEQTKAARKLAKTHICKAGTKARHPRKQEWSMQIKERERKRKKEKEREKREKKRKKEKERERKRKKEKHKERKRKRK